VLNIESEAIGERTRDAMSHKRSKGERVGNIQFRYRLRADGNTSSGPGRASRAGRDTPFAPKRGDFARHCRSTESPRAPDATRFGLAAEARSTNHQAGCDCSLKNTSAAGEVHLFL
jgi:hypothetical protein